MKISKRERARQPGRGKDRGHHRLTRVRPLCLCHVHWERHAMAGPERMATGNIARMVYFGACRDSRVNLPRPAVVAAPSFGPSRLRCWSRKAATPHWLREGAKCCCLDFRPPCAPPHPCCRPISRTSDLRVPGLVGFHVTLSDRQPEAYPMPVPASCQLRQHSIPVDSEERLPSAKWQRRRDRPHPSPTNISSKVRPGRCQAPAKTEIALPWG